MRIARGAEETQLKKVRISDMSLFKKEKSEENVCDHLYYQLFLEEDIKQNCDIFVFKCQKCGEETRLKVSKEAVKNIMWNIMWGISK